MPSPLFDPTPEAFFRVDWADTLRSLIACFSKTFVGFRSASAVYSDTIHEQTAAGILKAVDPSYSMDKMLR